MPTGSTFAAMSFTRRPALALVLAAGVLSPVDPRPSERPQPGIASVALSKASVVGGTTITADVVLDAPAAGLGQTVALTYSTTTGLAQAPKTATVSGGQRSVKVSISTAPVATTVTIAVAASTGASTKGAILTVTRPVLTSASLSRSSVQGGDSLGLTVTLDGNAPAGGLAMSLSFVPPIMGLLPPPGASFAGCTSAQVLDGACTSLWTEPSPQSLTFAEGGRQLQLALVAPAVRQTRHVTVNASLGSQRSLPVEIRQPRVSVLEFRSHCRGQKVTSAVSPSTIAGVVQTTDRVSSDGGFVSLASGSTAIAVPAIVELTESTSNGSTGTGLELSLNVATGVMRWGCFPVVVPAGLPPTQVAVTASAGGQRVTTSLQLVAPGLGALQLAPNSVRPNERVTIGVGLTAAAGAGGARVLLTSSDPALAPVPAEIVVGQGELQAATALHVGTPPGPPGTSTLVVITADHNGRKLTAQLRVVR